MAGSIASTAWNGTKSVLRFLEGSWGQSVGTAYRQAHLSNPNIGITNFNWGQAYRDHFTNVAKAAADAASKPAATGFWASIKNGLGKIPGLKFLGRNIGPILMFGPMLISAGKELFNGGGISGALKELAKGGIGWVGWSVGTAIAFACGATGMIIPFIAAMVVSSGASWLATKALGPSTAEKQEALLAQQKEFQQKIGFPLNNSNPDDILKDVKALEQRVYQGSNYANGSGRCFIA